MATPEPRSPDGKRRIPRGAQLPTGKGWRLITPGLGRRHKATLLKTFRVGDERVAVFHILPR